MCVGQWALSKPNAVEQTVKHIQGRLLQDKRMYYQWGYITKYSNADGFCEVWKRMLCASQYPLKHTVSLQNEAKEGS